MLICPLSAINREDGGAPLRCCSLNSKRAWKLPTIPAWAKILAAITAVSLSIIPALYGYYGATGALLGSELGLAILFLIYQLKKAPPPPPIPQPPIPLSLEMNPIF